MTTLTDLRQLRGYKPAAYDGRDGLQKLYEWLIATLATD
jgi:hypothetical protein